MEPVLIDDTLPLSGGAGADVVWMEPVIIDIDDTLPLSDGPEAVGAPPNNLETAPTLDAQPVSPNNIETAPTTDAQPVTPNNNLETAPTTDAQPLSQSPDGFPNTLIYPEDPPGDVPPNNNIEPAPTTTDIRAMTEQIVDHINDARVSRDPAMRGACMELALLEAQGILQVVDWLSTWRPNHELRRERILH